MSLDGPAFLSSEPIAGNYPATPRFRTWLRNLRTTVDLSQSVRKSIPLTSKNAALPITSMDGGTLNAGLYVVSWYATVTVPAGVSSSMQVSIAWVDQGVPKSWTAPAMTGNSVATVQGDQRIMFYTDASSPVSYSVAYASTPADAMMYDLRIVLQSVSL